MPYKVRALGTQSKYIWRKVSSGWSSMPKSTFHSSSRRTSKVRCVVCKNGLASQNNVAVPDVHSTCKVRAQLGLRQYKPYTFSIGKYPFFRERTTTLRCICFLYSYCLKKGRLFRWSYGHKAGTFNMPISYQ